MEKIKNWAVNVDKLKICLNMPADLYTYLKDNYTKYDNNTRILEEDNFNFNLVFIEEEETKMTAVLNVRDIEGYLKLGTFVFNCGKKYENKAFFSFENSALYKTYIKMSNNDSVNHICNLLYIIDYYNMTFNNITEVEIAFDTNYNFINKTRKMIKDIKKYDLYLNGKKVKDDEILDGYGEYYSRNRIKLSKTPTLYFSQAKTTDMKMKIYDKAKELDEQSPHKKEQMKEWLGWNDSNKIYRVEIVMHNTNVREFIDRYGKRMYKDIGEHENIMNLLDFRDFRLAMFLDSCDRLIYFKNKETQEKISLLEIAGI